MGDSAPQLQAMLATLRDAGTGQRACLRLHRIQTLAARLSGLDGRARAVLESRLHQLLQDAPPPTPDGASSPSTEAAAGNGLAALRQLRSELRARSGASFASLARSAPMPEATGDGVAPAADAHPAPLPALEAARQTWARLRMDDHLRHVMAEVPDDAGPMHSTVLVHRAIAVMQEAAPGYLQHFLGYADALATLERLCPLPATASPARTPRSRAAVPSASPSAGTRSRRRGRSRRD